MQKIRSILLLICLFPIFIFSQTFILDGSPIVSCDGYFTDSGGNSAGYAANENLTTTICPDGNSGTHSQLTFYGIALESEDELCFFDGEDISAPALACIEESHQNLFQIQATAANSSGCLTVQFTSNSEGENLGWNARINCISNCQKIEPILVNSEPALTTGDTAFIALCIGETLSLEAAGLYPQNGLIYDHSDMTSVFEWDFGDGHSAIGNFADHQYQESGGYTIRLKIIDQLECTNTDFLNVKVRVSTPPNFAYSVMPASEICLGETIEFSASLNEDNPNSLISVMPETNAFMPALLDINTDSLPLPDGVGVSYLSEIVVTNYEQGQVITDVADLQQICVVIEHSWLRDLEITLTCPNGNSMILHNHPGQTGGEFFLGEPVDGDDSGQPIPGVGYQYCWTANSTNGTWIEYANANMTGTLPAGDYASFDPFSNLLGCPLNGTWTMTFTDLWGIDNGYVFLSELVFDENLGGNIEMFQTEITDGAWEVSADVIYQSADSIAVLPESEGLKTYTYSVTDEFGCEWKTEVNVEVLGINNPSCNGCDMDEVTPEITCPDEPLLVEIENNLPPHVEVFISDFDYEVFDSCGVAAVSFSNDPLDTSIIYSCDDIGELLIQIWATDLNGNQSFCETFSIVSDDLFPCEPGLIVQGNITFPNENGISEVLVNLDGSVSESATVDGFYHFDNIPMGGDALITPEKDDIYTNGVSSFDVVLIQKHLLGTNPLTSPYQLIAADVNNSGSITTFDILLTRKLILLINDDFPNNTSYRFIDKAYEFPDPTNPWLEEFPETIAYNNMINDELAADFIGVKIGDVNGSANLWEADDRSSGILNFRINEQFIEEEEIFEVAFTADNFNHLGYQFTLEFSELEFLELREGLITEENFGLTLLENNVITTCFSEPMPVKIDKNETLFTLVFKSKITGRLSDHLEINSAFTPKMAYHFDESKQDIELKFQYYHRTQNEFNLYQNSPNPFAENTEISFRLPESKQAVLTFFDVNGKVLKTISGNFEKGFNVIEINEDELNTKGVIFYQLKTDSQKKVKKMIILSK